MARCREPATSSAGGFLFCRSHFISHCHAQLDGIAELFSHQRPREQTTPLGPIWYVLCEIATTAVTLGAQTQDLTAPEKDQLFEILLRAAELRLRKFAAASGK
jgi:hypothetical protein